MFLYTPTPDTLCFLRTGHFCVSRFLGCLGAALVLHEVCFFLTFPICRPYLIKSILNIWSAGVWLASWAAVKAGFAVAAVQSIFPLSLSFFICKA